MFKEIIIYCSSSRNSNNGSLDNGIKTIYFWMTIIDSDFEESILATSYWEAIVNVYEKRQLNVAANLALAILWQQNNSINDTKKLATELTNHKYDEQIEKYLILI